MNTPLLMTDGTIISVQASSGHYCSPRTDNPDKGYGSVEVLFYKDAEGFNDNQPENWMPVADLMELIAEHGGIIGGQLPALNFGNEMLIKNKTHFIAIKADELYRAELNKGDEQE
mgnify:CR=1 FL=1|tara:strand:- start:226 stop:570 length:345 start_codon:yes stop_codon:yes gene_type:complete